MDAYRRMHQFDQARAPVERCRQSHSGLTIRPGMRQRRATCYAQPDAATLRQPPHRSSDAADAIDPVNNQANHYRALLDACRLAGNVVFQGYARAMSTSDAVDRIAIDLDGVLTEHPAPELDR